MDDDYRGHFRAITSSLLRQPIITQYHAILLRSFVCLFFHWLSLDCFFAVVVVVVVVVVVFFGFSCAVGRITESYGAVTGSGLPVT